PTVLVHYKDRNNECRNQDFATVDGKLRTISESSIRRNLKQNDEEGISSLPDAELFENLALMHKHASPLRDDSQGEAFHTVSGLEARQDKANIIKTSALPHDSTPRVPSLAADEGSMQQQLNELTDLGTRLQRQQTEMVTKVAAQDLEISNLKAMIKFLKDKDGGRAKPSEEDATIKRRSLEIGEEAGWSSSGQCSPAAEVSTVGIPTGSGMVPTTSLIFTTACVVTPYSRRKGKEKMVESDTPKKKKLQEQIDVHVAREMEEQMAR
nr:hypothetical protein [Tanacetum cinerariifolium]